MYSRHNRNQYSDTSTTASEVNKQKKHKKEGGEHRKNINLKTAGETKINFSIMSGPRSLGENCWIAYLLGYQRLKQLVKKLKIEEVLSASSVIKGTKISVYSGT